MNERIIELAKDAGIKFIPLICDGIKYEYEDVDMDGSEDLKKFAELIVRETVKEMSDQLYWHGIEQSNNPSFYKAIQKTLKHFGVEE